MPVYTGKCVSCRQSKPLVAVAPGQERSAAVSDLSGRPIFAAVRRQADRGWCAPCWAPRFGALAEQRAAV